MMNTQPRLLCRNLSRRYRGGFALGPLNLEIREGVTCLVGPNGAGKSTLFRIIARIDRPTSGSLRPEFDHGTTTPHLGYLPQEPSLPEAATCRQFLRYVAWLQQMPGALREAAVATALDRVGLSARGDDKIRDLSGGMRRRLGIAHAIVHDPPLLLLDEPTAGLDPRQRIALRETVASLGPRRIVLVATHLVEDVRRMADRVVVLNQGRMVYDGDVPNLESKATHGTPGDTELERAISSLIGAEA